MPMQISFFFSSRRRHTRYIGDWSSDVCSSDLGCSSGDFIRASLSEGGGVSERPLRGKLETRGVVSGSFAALSRFGLRSEERRVGKECRFGGSRDGVTEEGVGQWAWGPGLIWYL